MIDAIKLAIEKGGYLWQGWVNEWYRMKSPATGFKNININCIMLDPKFWQALGKALGWRKCLPCTKPELDLPDLCEWLERAHDYFDLVLTGGDEAAYWKGILK